MKVKMNPNIAVRTSDPSAAFEFYSRVPGFQHRRENMTHTDLDADPINLFIIEDEQFAGPVMELFVDDLEQAKKELLSHGCRIIRWYGKGQDCYVKDPFGLVFNVWELN